MGILEKRQVAPKITMLIKKGRRAIENAEAIMHRLKAKYVGVEFETLQGEAVVTMSIKEQVSLLDVACQGSLQPLSLHLSLGLRFVDTLQLQAMSKTSILITPCGGTGTVLTFLPPGASAVVMNFWQSVAGRSEQMESLYYWNIEYLDIQYFPILLEDYEETKDRPACEKPADDPYFEQ